MLSRFAARAGSLSPEIAAAAGRALGDLRLRFCRREAAAVRGNIRLLRLADESRDAQHASDAARVRRAEAAIVRDTFRAFGLFVVEFFGGLTLAPHEIARGWELSGREHLAAVASSGQGFILAGAHTGNWEHLGAIGPLLGRRIVAPVGVQFHPFISGAVMRAKARRGVQAADSAAHHRELLRALARGDLVALPVDGGSFRRGIPVYLRGARIRLAGGAAHLAARSGCAILPVFSTRTGFMLQDVRIGPPIWPTGQPGERERIMQQLADLLGEHLRHAGSQWCLFRSLSLADS